MIRAKKSFGQHFLTNESIARSIVEALERFGPIGHLLEIGPGRGMLSKYLAEKYPGCTLVDADQDMVRLLSADPRYALCRLIQADFLKLDLATLFGGAPLVIIGNFPYNISSQIVIKMIDNRDLVTGMVGMFQKEMGQRIAHKPGSREYGVISVLTQAYYDVEYLLTVNEGNFSPPPKVKSAVLRFSRKPVFHLDCDESRFRTVVKSCFLQKRKMIRNSLKSQLSPEILSDKFFDQRPEQLSVQDYVGIVKKLESISPGG